MEISKFKAKQYTVKNRKEAIKLLGEFLSYQSAKENSEGSFNREIDDFKKFLRTAEQFAQEHSIPFNIYLYCEILENTCNLVPNWSSSTGSCGWVNDDERPDYD